MNNEITIRISGEAGQGMQTVGMALCGIYKKNGYDIFANQDYMSRIRGGNNYFQIRIRNKPIHTLRQKSDIVVALDRSSVDIHRSEISSNGIMVLDKKKYKIMENSDIFFDIPLYDLAVNSGGSELFVSMVSCGVLGAMTGIEVLGIEGIIKDSFSDKKEDIVKKNVDAVRAGFIYAKDNFKKDIYEIERGRGNGDLLLNGNDAIALGAIKAGCKFYSAYPMTPSTSIMNVISRYAKEFNIVVEQAEDEIAAVNMIIGASFAGVRSMSATSGGGFCLMVEGISLSGMTETPIVIVDAQRPAPATGFPTRTEQADLGFVLHAGHGEFAKAVFTPGSTEEAFALTIKAFDIAEKYQIPVIIMTDQHLADSCRDTTLADLNKNTVKRHIITKDDSGDVKEYKRYRFTDSGISPRAIPSWIEDVIYADSDEHNEEGHITESGEIRRNMVDKRFYKKMEGLSKEVIPPVANNVKDADVVLIGFGSTHGVNKEVSETFRDKKIGFAHLPQVWPFPSADLADLLKGKKTIITVENNAGAQLAKLIKQETDINIAGSILKYDGRPFDLDYLIDKVREIKI